MADEFIRVARRVFCATGIAVAFCLSAFAGRLTAAPLTLDIPVAERGYGLKFYLETARQFEALRPDVRINLYGDPRIDDKVRVRIVDGNYPDATFSPALLWPALIRAGKVLDLTPYLKGPNWDGDARWGDTFLPGALDSWRIDERTCGVPLSYACWTIFYNRELFRKHGWTTPRTWDEFFNLCDRMKAVGMAPLSLAGLYGNYPDAFFRAAFYNLAGAEGWRALNSIEPGARRDPRFIRAAALLQRVTQNYTLTGWEGATHTSAQLAFLQGRAAMTVSGSWMIHEMAGKIPPGFEIGAMNFPVFPEGISDPTTIQTNSDSFFVFATGRTEHERAAVDFMRFMTSRARAEAFVRQQDAPAAVRGVPLEAFSERMQETAALIAQSREAFNMPQVMMQPPNTRQATIDGRLKLMTGRITPEEFSARTENAAAIDRARAADPDRIEYRHPLGGALLLMGVTATALWLALGRRRTSAKEAQIAEKSARGPRLRGPVAVGLIGPAIIFYAGIVLIPGVTALAWALTRWDGITARSWTGVLNFKWLLFESDVFWTALGNNLYLMVVPAVVVVPLALGFATLLHRGTWGADVFRVCFLFPNMLGGIAATLLWLSAYEPHGGLVNAALVSLGKISGSAWLVSFDNYPWLAPANLYPALIPIYIWMACGFNLVLYLAAMEGIDPELYDAAELDGANRWGQFWHVTLPQIREVLGISVVFIVIGGLNAFEMIWLLTSQDPDSGSHTLGTLMVSTLFKDFQIGRATAIAAVMFVLVFLGSALVLKMSQRKERA